MLADELLAQLGKMYCIWAKVGRYLEGVDAVKGARTDGAASCLRSKSYGDLHMIFSTGIRLRLEADLLGSLRQPHQSQMMILQEYVLCHGGWLKGLRLPYSQTQLLLFSQR